MSKRKQRIRYASPQLLVSGLLPVIFVTVAISQPTMPATCERGLNPERIQACTELLRHEQPRDKLQTIYKNRGRAYLSSRQYDLAVQDYDIVLALDPNDIEALYDRGWALYGLRQFDRAAADADSIIARGENFSAHQLRCRALGELSQFDEALRSCTEQLRRAPLGVSLYDRGSVYLMAGQYDLAIADFDAMLKIEKDSYFAMLGRGEAMFAKRDYAAALQEFDRANRAALGTSHASWPIAISKRGLANEALGRRSAAIADFREALSGDPDLDESKEGLNRLGAPPKAPQSKPWWRFW